MCFKKKKKSSHVLETKCSFFFFFACFCLFLHKKKKKKPVDRFPAQFWLSFFLVQFEFTLALHLLFFFFFVGNLCFIVYKLFEEEYGLDCFAIRMLRFPVAATNEINNKKKISVRCLRWSQLSLSLVHS